MRRRSPRRDLAGKALAILARRPRRRSDLLELVGRGGRRALDQLHADGLVEITTLRVAEAFDNSYYNHEYAITAAGRAELQAKISAGFNSVGGRES